jgi:hypothetical protein
MASMIQSKMIYKVIIFVISFGVFIGTTTSKSNSELTSNKISFASIKLKEYSLDQNKVNLILPDWTNNPENSPTKLQLLNPSTREELNFGYVDTNESLESYWTTTYKDIKEANLEKTILVQDSKLGKYNSKLLCINKDESNEFNTTVHYSVIENRVYTLTFISPTTKCTDSIFIEISKIALTLK